MPGPPVPGAGGPHAQLIGGRGWTYDETVAGGQGASSSGDGPSGVHVGMTNTLNTPIEALELEYPMRVERYGLAEASGGDGQHRGSDGVVRSIRVLEEVTVNLLTDRRRHAPHGVRGGSPRAVGRNSLDRMAGEKDPVHEELPPKVVRQLAAGDVVTVVSPGGAAGARKAPGSGGPPQRTGAPPPSAQQPAAKAVTLARPATFAGTALPTAYAPAGPPVPADPVRPGGPGQVLAMV